MSALDLRLAGDVDSVRGTAAGMAGLGDAVDNAGAGFGRASAESESLWTGSAADAFRTRISSAHRATVAVAAASRRMSTALRTFADRMASVRAEIARARSVAESAGLHVAGDTVHEPTPPPPPPTACYTPRAAAQMARQQAAAQAEYRRQVRAFRQAEQLLTDARKAEQAAHGDVSRVADEEKGVLAGLNDDKYWLLGGTATETVADALEQRAVWARRTQALGLEYDRLASAARQAEDPALRTALSADATEALDRTASASKATVSNARLGLGVDPESTAGKALGHLPDGFAAAEAAWAVTHAHGTKGKVVAGAAAAASYGAGEATSAAVSSAIEGVAIGGAPETLGVSVAVAAAAYGAGLLVQHYGPAVYDWVGHAASDVGSAITHPGRTLSSLADDLGL